MLELGRLSDFFGGRQCQQARIAAHLAQLEQRIQNVDLRLGQPLGVEGFAHRFFGRQAYRFVQVGLLALQLDAGDALNFVGQFGGHLAFGSAQHERCDAATQLVEPLTVAEFFDGVAKQVLEALLAAQKTRHQKVEQTPQFAQMVLHGCAGQAQAMPRIEFPHHLRRMGVGVFDVLCLIEHHQMPGLLQPALAVARQQGVGRHHHVVAGHLSSGIVPVLAVQHQHTQRGRKTFGLASPVAHQTDRGYDQRRAREATCFFLDQDMRKRLQGFAQPHVVGQDAAQAVVAKELQPVQALLLVRTHLGLQTRGYRHHGQFGVAAQLLYCGLQCRSAVPHRTFTQGSTGAQCVHAGEFEAVTRKIVCTVPYQFQQCSHPGAQGFGGYPHEPYTAGCSKVHEG